MTSFFFVLGRKASVGLINTKFGPTVSNLIVKFGYPRYIGVRDMSCNYHLCHTILKSWENPEYCTINVQQQLKWAKQV